MNYAIGDPIIYIQHSYEATREVCDQCFGKKFLTVILGNDEHVTIECQNCLERAGSGYYGFEKTPSGYTNHRMGKWVARHGNVTGMSKAWGTEAEEYPVQYAIHGDQPSGSLIHESLDSAQLEVDRLNKAADEFEAGTNKNKDNRSHNGESQSWAWQARYNRNQIKEAIKDIAYASERIKIANKYRRDDETTHLPKGLDETLDNAKQLV